ncbi:chorismate mutase [Caloramator quimbayensis]|uniref:UPF0735 ACT domain-containing protein SAMN05443428_101272 n=1 Tax=Caloramator quimbayensis TaxID=1147123 RepID=A0A1T4WHP8_9CLOT|nr:ACT domain-containing protein [Caloramator quimbayensis]SKA76844.1 chorismate mutase [Caloramator quimbayensis]
MVQKYYLVDERAVPEIFVKVIKVKELLRTGKAKDISDAVCQIGISRSTYYKYKDYIFSVSDGMMGHKATFSFLIHHKPGALSVILNEIAENKGNILTINQDIPINKVANVTITVDMSNMDIEIDDFIKKIKNIDYVIDVNIAAME